MPLLSFFLFAYQIQKLLQRNKKPKGPTAAREFKGLNRKKQETKSKLRATRRTTTYVEGGSKNMQKPNSNSRTWNRKCSKGKGCSLIQGRFKSETRVPLYFPGCSSRKSLTVTDIECSSRSWKKQLIRASCVQGKTSPGFRADTIVLSVPLNASAVRLEQLKDPP